jgi:hypothetical protein
MLPRGCEWAERAIGPRSGAKAKPSTILRLTTVPRPFLSANQARAPPAGSIRHPFPRGVKRPAAFVIERWHGGEGELVRL